MGVKHTPISKKQSQLYCVLYRTFCGIKNELITESTADLLRLDPSKLPSEVDPIEAVLFSQQYCRVDESGTRLRGFKLQLGILCKFQPRVSTNTVL